MKQSYKDILRTHGWLVLALCVWCAMTVVGLGEYMRCNPHLLMGILAMPFAFGGIHVAERSVRWLVGSMVFVALFLAGGPTVCLHLGAGMALFGLVEAFVGKLSVYAIGLWAMLSPVPDAVIGPFTFEWRLKLSQLVGTTFQVMGSAVTVEGTGFVVNGQPFSVEAACLGLSSINTGIILLLAMLASQRQRIRWIQQVVIWLTVAVLLLASNLFRIGLIVFFHAPPETALHEIIGILSLVVYVVLPMGWMVRSFASRNLFAKNVGVEKASSSGMNSASKVLAFITLITLAIGLYVLQQRPVIGVNPIPPISMAGFEHTTLQEGIVKLENKDAIIYLKPGVQPWRSEHSPTICWRGGGYNVVQKDQLTLANSLVVNAGTLHKGADSLATLWWFANGVSATASPVVWRKRTMSGEPAFWLINVTAATPADAARVTEALVAGNLALGGR